MQNSPSYPQTNAVYWITDECSKTTKKRLIKTDLQSEDHIKKGMWMRGKWTDKYSTEKFSKNKNTEFKTFKTSMSQNKICIALTDRI